LRTSRPLQPHGVDPVDLLEQHLDLLVAGGGHVLAHVVGPDRQLAVPAVDEHRQLHRAGSAVVGEGVERGPHGAAGHQDVVDEHHERVVEPAVGDVGALQRPRRAAAQVVAVERGVHDADREGGAAELGDGRAQPPGEQRAAGGDADEDHVLDPCGLLDDLVGDAGDGAGHVGGAEQLPRGRRTRAIVRHGSLLPRLAGRA
jgi:hypothetical protein